HMVYIKSRDLEERTELISYIKEKEVLCVFHYIPLHSSPAGQQFGRFHGEDVYTTRESERLMRLPMYYSLKEEQVDYIIDQILKFYAQR
ncbi:MAG: DegT/DnrJ/EryC1/StrS family aminotransferase, partial [Lachnospiraceae bacterium]|nr:DegT/DnrJ/EryC1/StrS family aminotransferase [Lachnospiraceae bacterium]